MQQKLMLQIPTPCHENWNNMDASTTNQPGKFCGSCQKNVVDFTSMSDAQVLAYFSANATNTCGRFENDQLNRVLATPPPPKKTWYKWMMAALISGFIFSNKSKAQTTGKLGEVSICQTKPPLQLMGDTVKHRPIIMGKAFYPASVQQNPTYILQGSVIDVTGRPISGASVMIKGTKNGAATDTNGKFSIVYVDKNLNLPLQISYVGYEMVYKEVDLSDQINKSNTQKIDLKIVLNPITLSEYVTVGMVAVVHKPKKINKVLDTLRNVLPKLTPPTTDKLVVAPNPAKAGSSINLTFGKAGDYQVQLFNLQSVMIQNQKITIAADGVKATFNLPASIAQGEYFISATNQQSKNLSTGKLVIQ